MRTTAASLWIVLAIGGLVHASSPREERDFITGSNFDRQLSYPASIYWSEVPLRKALHDLSTARQIAVWLDRRCDPSQLLDFRAQASLRECLWQLSDQHEHLDVAWIRGIVVVGPEGLPDRFATVHQVHEKFVAQLPRAIRNRWQAETAVSWPRLTNPQELLEAIEAEVGASIAGKQRVLHDLWPATQLPPLPAYTRLELLLVGYELTFLMAEDGAVKIVDLPAHPRYVTSVPRHQLARVQEVIANHPTAQLDLTTNPARLLAAWRVHQNVATALTAKPSSSAPGPEVLYSLRADNQPFGPFARNVCKQLNLSVDFSASATSHLERRISFEVSRVDVATLIRSMMEAAQLRYELQGQSLRVLGPDPPERP